MCCVICRRPTFSEAKRVLYTLLSVFEPSSHALQALADRSKPAAARPPKPSLKKEEAVTTTEPEVQAPKASLLYCHTKRSCKVCFATPQLVPCHDHGILIPNALLPMATCPKQASSTTTRLSDKGQLQAPHWGPTFAKMVYPNACLQEGSMQQDWVSVFVLHTCLPTH